jgi:hypothetical protein
MTKPDYARILSELWLKSELVKIGLADPLFADAAEAIEKLLGFASWIADKAIALPEDNDYLSPEVVLRKLWKIGIVDMDGDSWVFRREEEHTDDGS